MRKTASQWLNGSIFDCPDEFFLYYPEYVDWYEVLVHDRYFDNQAIDQILIQRISKQLKEILSDIQKSSSYDFPISTLFWKIIIRGVHIPAKLLNDMFSEGIADLFLDTARFTCYIDEYLTDKTIDNELLMNASFPNRIIDYFPEFHKLSDEIKTLIKMQSF